MRSLKIFTHWLFIAFALVPAWKAWGYWKEWEAGGVQGGGFNAAISMIIMLLIIIAIGEVGCRVYDLLWELGELQEDQ